MSETPTVVVTGAGALLGQGIIRALRLASLPVRVVAVDPDPRAVGLYWADSAHLVPMVKDGAYEGAIREILDVERPAVLFVGTDIELPFFSRHRRSLEAEHGTAILVSDPSVVEIADDKWSTVRFLRENRFPYPKSTLSLEDAEFFSEVEFPLIVKPRRGARSIGFAVVRSRKELERAFRAVEEPIVQEHVGSPEAEYTAGALVFDGRCCGTIVMRRDLRDGNTYRAFVDAYPELNDEVRRLSERLAPHGPANFQFRMDGGQAKVFEINARFSGTTPLRARAGFNEVEMCLRFLLTGEEIQPTPVRPLVMLRHWEETVVEPRELDSMRTSRRSRRRAMLEWQRK
jgi:carbamoyl-phosphate synthase large subunit